eukprot:7489795-Pyramimonas_sp.AAC.1
MPRKSLRGKTESKSYKMKYGHTIGRRELARTLADATGSTQVLGIAMLQALATTFLTELASR